MTWAIVCLVAAVVAERTGPDAGAIYLVALGVAVIALAFILAPETLRHPGQAGQGRRERGEGSAH
jgi:hypothetical protein